MSNPKLWRTTSIFTALTLVLIANSNGQSTGNLINLEVKQVIDDNTAVLTVSGTDYWYIGDTTDWADGEPTRTDRYVITEGTHQYDTAPGGTRTIRQLRDATEAEIKSEGLEPIADSKNPDTTQFFSGEINAIQVLNDDSALVELESFSDNHTLLYRGSTTGWIDGEIQQLPKAKIQGIHRYDSVSGSIRTVRVVQSATDVEWSQHIATENAIRLNHEKEIAAKLADENSAKVATMTKIESAKPVWQAIQPTRIGVIRGKDDSIITTKAFIVGFVDLKNKTKGIERFSASPSLEQNHAIFTTKELENKFVAVAVTALDDAVVKKLKPSFETAIAIQQKTGVSFAVAVGIESLSNEEVLYPDTPDLANSSWSKSGKRIGLGGGMPSPSGGR